MNKWSSGTGFGVNYRLRWFKSRCRQLQVFWLKIKSKKRKINNLPNVVEGRTSGLVVQALVLNIGYVGSNLVADSCKYFGLKLSKKTLGKVNNLSPTV